MAVSAIDNDIIYVSGIKYTHTTDDSSDWDSVSNDTYFYDLDTKLPYYKNGDGDVLYLFQNSSGGDSIYTADETVGSDRIVTLTDTLTFKGIGTSIGQRNLIIRDSNNDYILENYDNGYFKRTIRSGSNLGVIANAGLTQGLWLQTVSELAGTGGLLIKNSKADTNYLKYFTDNFKAPDAQWYSNGAIHHRIRSNGTSSTVLSQVSFFIQGFYGFGFNVGASAPIGTENISLQGETVIKGDGTTTGTTLALYDNDTTPNKTWEWLDNGNVNVNQNTDINTSNTFNFVNGSKEVGIASWNVHAYWGVNNGTRRWDMISANSSSIFNANEFGIANGSSVPIRIFNDTSVALGNVNKSNLNNSYSVQTAGDTLIGGDLHATDGSNIIELDFNNYPKVKLGTPTQEWWLIEGDGTGSVFDNGDLYFYDSTNSRKVLHFKANGTINIPNLPTSNSGLSAGDLWNDNGSVRIGTSASNGGSGTKVLVKGAMGANQVADNTTPVVEFVTTGTPDGGALDVNSEWDNSTHRFTVGSSGAGTYLIQSQLFLNNGTGWSTLYLYKNGSVYSSFGGNGTDSSSTWDNLDGTIPIDLVVGDYIDIRCFSSSNGTIDFNNWDDRQSFSITKVSAVAPAAGTDVNALHTNISNEINSVTEKTDPSNTDKVLIEESDGTKKSQSRKNFKRLVVSTTTTSSSLTPSIDDEEAYVLTALSDNLTINAPTGTPYDFQTLWFRITDNGVSRTISTNAVFVDYTGNFPTSTTPNKQLIFASQWDGSNWNILAWKTQP